MIAQDLGVKFDALQTTSESTNALIKIRQADPAPSDSSSGFNWVPLAIAAGTLGLVAYTLIKKK